MALTNLEDAPDMWGKVYGYSEGPRLPLYSVIGRRLL